LRAIRKQGEIIFDGTGPRDKSHFDNIANLEVCFAGLGKDADTVIENKIKANTAPKRLSIVSSDRRLRDAARARRATAVKSEVFWDNLHKQLKRKKPVKEPEAKRVGLSESETKQWLEFFGIEQ
jgi:predicted RNA-binding protein with PIN domain